MHLEVHSILKLTIVPTPPPPVPSEQQSPQIIRSEHKCSLDMLLGAHDQVQVENQSWWAIEVRELRGTSTLHPVVQVLQASLQDTSQQPIISPIV